MSYGGYFDIQNKKNRIVELENKMIENGFWDDQEKSSLVISELNNLKNIIKDIDDIYKRVTDVNEMFDDSIDEDTKNLIEEEVTDICVLEIHSGAGGTESCDFVNMLYRMYLRFLDRKGYKYEVIDYLEGEEVGIKSVSIRVVGLYSYGYLKCEKGIHRMVRLSPFDSNHKRHTTFASVLVTPELDDVSDIEIDSKDLKIDVYRSSGKGGQGVNTTDSAVRITHLPTGIVVTCQNERSQLQNKEYALKILKNKLKIIEIEKKEQELNNIKGEQKNIEFGSQIRSYVMHPYSMVKDHRTNYETSNVEKVLDGEIDMFIEEKLKSDRYEG